MTKFILRPWTRADLDSLVKYANNPKIAANLNDCFPYPYSLSDGERYLDMVLKLQEPPNILAIDVEGEAVGSIGIQVQEDVHRKNAELGYWLAEPLWGRGIMTAAIRQMVDYALEHWDIQRVFSRPYGPNMGSQRALKKAGFTFEAKFQGTVYKNGFYLDEVYYAIRRKPA